MGGYLRVQARALIGPITDPAIQALISRCLDAFETSVRQIPSPEWSPFDKPCFQEREAQSKENNTSEMICNEIENTLLQLDKLK